MWFKFNWDMFITSFVPLWLFIFLCDLFDIFENAITAISTQKNFINIICYITFESLTQLISIVIILIIVILSIFGVTNYFKKLESSKQILKGTIRNARKSNKQSSDFFLAYIIPLIAFDFSELRSIILFVFYFAILAFLCIRNNNIYTNIMLELMKYRMYTCDIERVFPGNKIKVFTDSLVISKEDLSSIVGKKLKLADLENYIYINVEENNSNE